MASRRRAIIHIGQTKAGSTSIQNFLDNERQALRDRGFLFPDTGFSRKNPFDRSRTSGHLDLLRPDPDLLPALRTELAENPDCHLLLSAENILNDRPDAEITRLARELQDFDIEIVAILRPQADWLRSIYLEHVMSGFIADHLTFPAFVRKLWQTGRLDYIGRLQHVSQLLGAHLIHGISFAHAKDDLLANFLEATGIPLTNPVLAAQEHANRREKIAPLVEAMRRLNIMATGLTMAGRLELEHRLRVLRLPDALAAAEGEIFHPPIPLGPRQLGQIEEGNAALTAAGILSAPLPIGNLEGAQGTPSTIATDWFKDHAIEIAATIAIHALDPRKQSLSLLRFGLKDCRKLAQAMKNAQVSFHLNSEETALLAACENHRLAWLHLPRRRSSTRRAATLEKYVTPSPLIIDTEISRAIEDLPRPDIMVAGARSECAELVNLIEIWHPAVIILLEDAQRYLVDIPVVGYRIETNMNCLFLFYVDKGPALT